MKYYALVKITLTQAVEFESDADPRSDDELNDIAIEKAKEAGILHATNVEADVLELDYA